MEVLSNHTSAGSLGFACLLTLALKPSRGFCHRFLSVPGPDDNLPQGEFCFWNLAVPLRILLTPTEQDLSLCCNLNTNLPLHFDNPQLYEAKCLHPLPSYILPPKFQKLSHKFIPPEKTILSSPTSQLNLTWIAEKLWPFHGELVTFDLSLKNALVDAFSWS